MKKRYDINMLEGPLLGKIAMFAVPLALTSILQAFYNTTDMVVVGRFAGSAALAAVGATTSAIHLAINFCNGLSVGTNIALAQSIGAGKRKEASEYIHTAVLLSLLLGIILSIASIFFVAPLLRLLDTPKDIFKLAETYLKIYFLGAPGLLLYNYCSAILRTSGDTKRPFYFLFVSGIINVLLNLLLVIKFHMSTAGVAIATVASQYVSAALVFVTLLRNEGYCKVEIKKIAIYPKKLLKMLALGLPASLQGMLFSFSNMIIQSAINSFGSIAVAGNSAAANIEGYVYVTTNSFMQAALVFGGQNYGAGKLKRVNRTLFDCIILSIASWAVMFTIISCLRTQILSLYIPNDPKAVKYGIIRFDYILFSYVLCGTMEIPVGAMRGMGKTLLPTIVSLMGACLLRIVWIYTVFAKVHTLGCLYLSYPVSWAVTQVVHYVCYTMLYHKAKKRIASENTGETVAETN